MWIADAGEVREKQSMLNVNKKIATPEGGKQDNSILANSEKEKGVTVDISEQGLEFLQQQMENAKKSAEGKGKAYDDMGKLMEIARRIAKGDKVPPKDEKKLMEFSFELYQTAKMSASMHQNKKRKEHKSLFEDEDDNSMREKVRALRQEAASAEPVSETSAASADTAAETAE